MNKQQWQQGLGCNSRSRWIVVWCSCIVTKCHNQSGSWCSVQLNDCKQTATVMRVVDFLLLIRVYVGQNNQIKPTLSIWYMACWYWNYCVFAVAAVQVHAGVHAFTCTQPQWVKKKGKMVSLCIVWLCYVNPFRSYTPFCCFDITSPFGRMAWTAYQLSVGLGSTFPQNLVHLFKSFFVISPSYGHAPFLSSWHEHKHTPSHTWPPCQILSS